MPKLKKKTILVLGGSGFLGSHVIDKLVEKKYKVINYDINKSKWPNKLCQNIYGNIKNLNKLEKFIKVSDYIYNFAGVGDLDYGSEHPIETITENILNNAKILELCVKHKVKRFIYSSTVYVYSDKGGFYKSSKQAAENYIEEFRKKFNLNYTILRFGSLYGPRSNRNNGLYSIIYNYLKNKKIVYSGNSSTLREYIHINDAATSCVDILSDKFRNKHIILSGKRKILVKKILEKLSKKLKYNREILYKNTKNLVHYNLTPYTFMPNYGEKYFNTNMRNINLEIDDLINYVKKNEGYE